MEYALLAAFVAGVAAILIGWALRGVAAGADVARLEARVLEVAGERDRAIATADYRATLLAEAKALRDAMARGQAVAGERAAALDAALGDVAAGPVDPARELAAVERLLSARAAAAAPRDPGRAAPPPPPGAGPPAGDGRAASPVGPGGPGGAPRA